MWSNPNGIEGRCIEHGSRADTRSDDRGAYSDDRGCGQSERTDLVFPGNFHAAVFLPESGSQLASTRAEPKVIDELSNKSAT